MRYRIAAFSVSLTGVYDEQTKDFVKNPQSGRRQLFHQRRSAEKLLAELSAKEEIALRKKEGETR